MDSRMGGRCCRRKSFAVEVETSLRGAGGSECRVDKRHFGDRSVTLHLLARPGRIAYEHDGERVGQGEGLIDDRLRILQSDLAQRRAVVVDVVRSESEELDLAHR